MYADSYIWLSDTHRTYCSAVTVTTVTRTRYNVTLYAHCLSYIRSCLLSPASTEYDDSRFPRNVCTYQSTPLYILYVTIVLTAVLA